MGRHGAAALDVAADLLGMTVDELATELRDGATIAELAGAQGVSLDSIVEAYKAQAAEKLAEAVEGGRITQERADEMLESMGERYLEMLENGMPFRDGPGRFGPRGGEQELEQNDA
jgi:hypothetical protein